MLTLFSRRRQGLAAYARRFAEAARDAAIPAADIYERSRDYHRALPPGKMATVTTKPMRTAAELALAYSPGVAGPCLDIARDPAAAYTMTNKGRTVAVISNGTSVLGLGNIGALAGKPVMEGKAALFKTFAELDAIDICIDEADPQKLAEIIIALAPSFGGINLEDIKAPDCFLVEDLCRARMDIPVFHDDQHGTATVILAGLLNALALTGRKIENLRLVVSGAGAASIATLDLLVATGVRKKNITVFDSGGVLHTGRRDLEPRRAIYARAGAPKTLELALKGADMFLGVSRAGAVHPDWVRAMAPQPIIFALANPEPEIWPAHAREASPQAIVATGRSDFPNQVNNVLCFPFLFRGALDVRARTITRGMQLAAAHAIASLVHTQPGPETAAAYPNESFAFGPDYILPKPFDRRLFATVPGAVSKAARAEGVARI